MYYLYIINNHKWVSIRRKESFKQDLFITCMVLSFVLFLVIHMIITVSGISDFLIADYILPITLLFEFSIRFLLKPNPTVGILPYLCLPVKKQTLISYILISELFSFWIWGCLIIYWFAFYQCGYFTGFSSIINFTTVVIFVLFNNYITYLIKNLMGGYSILIYPVCLIVVIFIQMIVLSFSPVIGLFLSVSMLFAVLFILNIILKNAIYKELNNFA